MLSRLRKTIASACAGALVVALMVCVAVGAAMPTWARLVFGPEAHTCTCEATSGHGHAHCACPLCFPELRAEDDTTGDEGTGGVAADGPKVTGRCGKDDPGWRTLACAAVPPSSFVIAPAPENAAAELTVSTIVSQWSTLPDLPPPRRGVVASIPRHA